MADIRAEDRVDPGTERIDLAKGYCIHSVVRLAAEIEGPGIEVDPVLFTDDLARGVIVVHLDPAVELVIRGVRPAVSALKFGGDFPIAVFADKLCQQRTVKLFRVHVFEPCLAAPLPMLDQIGEELACPAGAAFEEAKTQVGKATRHAAK